MTPLMSTAFIGALLFGAVTAAVPLLLAGLGEQMSEKSGVLNIGLEGMMIAGSFAGFATALASGSFWLGFGAGAAAGMAAALIVALLCVRLGLDQVVVGVGLTLGCQGLTALLHHVHFARTYPRLPAASVTSVPFLADLPVLGPALFRHHALVYLAFALVAVMAFVYRRLTLGLHLKAAGDRPDALEAAGIDVIRTRTAAVLATGAMAGLGGAYLAQVGAAVFVPFVTNGAGFLAIVLAMLARGRPLWVLLGALLFGLCLALATALQVAGVDVPTDAVQAIPYLAVMTVLVMFGRRSRLPAALGAPYSRDGG
ncbi:MAG TPA: ABC transporter permease [Mesorhizobium sp.]|nr:ABC transporter permease [Mesorhizobium sp.]